MINLTEYIEAMKLNQKEYLNSVWKTFAALMVAIGWIVSSDNAREMYSGNLFVTIVSIIVVVGMAIMHWLTLNDLFHRSQKVQQAMPELNNGDAIIVQNYEIKRIHTLASITINGLLYSLLIVVILDSYKCSVC